MVFTKKIDRAFQWAGEKMGQESKITHTDDFRMLETEMALRHDGMLYSLRSWSLSGQQANLLSLKKAWTVSKSQ
jgi:hypothetical protein